METVLYADLFLLCDFCMDIISLCLAGKLCRLKLRKGRIVAGAVFGAGLSLCVTLFSPVKYLKFAATLIGSVIMVLISFGKGRFIRILRRATVLWATGGLIGGIVSALLTVGPSHGGRKSFYAVLALSVIAVLLTARIVLRRPASTESFVKVTFFGKAVAFSGLVDSGNFLRDPFSGTPVIIVSPSVANKLFEEDELLFLLGTSENDVPQTLFGRVRVIPSRTVGSDSLIRAVKPDSVTVDGIQRDVLVSVASSPGGLGRFDGIIPPSISVSC